MIRDNLKGLIETVIHDEAKDIIQTYGKGYNTEAEFLKILEWEIEEAKEEFNQVNIYYELLNENGRQHIKDKQEQLLNLLKKTIRNAMCELAQCAAVIERYSH